MHAYKAVGQVLVQLTDFIFEIDNIITNVQLSEDDKELKIREIITGVLQ